MAKKSFFFSSACPIEKVFLHPLAGKENDYFFGLRYHPFTGTILSDLEIVLTILGAHNLMVKLKDCLHHCH